MPILRLSLKRYMAVCQIMKNDIQKLIKSILIVGMGIGLSVIIMMNLANLYRFLEVKMLFIILWKK